MRQILPKTEVKSKVLPSSKNRLTHGPSLCYFSLLPNCMPVCAEVAQLVEQRPEKPRVRSSILRLGTIFPLHFIPHLGHSLSNSPNCSIFSPGNGTGYSP